MTFLILLNALFSFSAPTQLEGIWLRPCQNATIQIQFFENHLNFSNDIFFVDAACTQPLLAFSNDGSFKVEKENIDFQFSKITLTLYTEQLIQDYNKRKVCGFNDWQNNSPREITGMKCALFQEGKVVQVPRAGEFRYGIWKISFDKLYFGQLTPEQDGTSSEKRPAQWDARVYLRQQ